MSPYCNAVGTPNDSGDLERFRPTEPPDDAPQDAKDTRATMRSRLGAAAADPSTVSAVLVDVPVAWLPADESSAEADDRPRPASSGVTGATP